MKKIIIFKEYEKAVHNSALLCYFPPLLLLFWGDATKFIPFYFMAMLAALFFIASLIIFFKILDPVLNVLHPHSKEVGVISLLISYSLNMCILWWGTTSLLMYITFGVFAFIFTMQQVCIANYISRQKKKSRKRRTN